MFHLVINTITAIGWFKMPGHTWFDKYELRQIKNLMADLRYIFTMMLTFACHLNFYPF
jgi:hypothetical protein